MYHYYQGQAMFGIVSGSGGRNTTGFQHMCSVVVTVMLSLMLCHLTEADEPLEVICPKDPFADDATAGGGGGTQNADDDYCTCDIRSIRSSKILQVQCDFRFEKDVLLTDRIYNIREGSFSSAYVRIDKAKSVRVTASFLREWQQALSSALDLWHSGPVHLAASPALPRRLSASKTFVGLGIIDCQVASLPAMLIRDHHRGAVRIKDCTVGVVEPGFIHNIEELRYLVFEDSVVGSIAGPVTSKPPLTLSHKELHTWNGLLISNVTIDSVAPNAFNLTHKSDVEDVVLKNNKFGVFGTAALTVSGDISLVITGNVFHSLQQGAFQTKDVKEVRFTDNTVESWSSGALTGLQCTSNTSLDGSNTFIIDPAPEGQAPPPLTFHPSCNNPKVRVIISKKAEKLLSNDNDDAGGGGGGVAAVLVLLALVCAGGGLAAGVWWWRGRSVWMNTKRDTPLCEDQDQDQQDSVGIPKI